MAQPQPYPRTPGSREQPPMFATAVGGGDECNYCRYRGRKPAPVKFVLPGGVQVCPVCDCG